MGVQEDTTYYMELPWQLVAAKQHRLRHRCVYRLRWALMVVGGLFIVIFTVLTLTP